MAKESMMALKDAESGIGRIWWLIHRMKEGKGKVQGNSQGLESREEKWEQQEQNGCDGKWGVNILFKN